MNNYKSLSERVEIKVEPYHSVVYLDGAEVASSSSEYHEGEIRTFASGIDLGLKASASGQNEATASEVRVDAVVIGKVVDEIEGRVENMLENAKEFAELKDYDTANRISLKIDGMKYAQDIIRNHFSQ